MTAVAAAAAPSWWGGRRGPDFIATEIVGPDAIADLAAVRFDHRRLRERATAGIEPIVDALALRVLGAARRRAMTTGQLAAACGVSPSGARRAIRLAVDAGALVREGRFAYRTHAAWGPGSARVVAVELKLENWTAALAQARAYSRWANVAWALLARTPPAAALESAVYDGVGVAVITPSGDVRPVVRPSARRRPEERWAALWVGEQVLARALRGGFRPLEPAQRFTAPRATPAGALAASPP